MVAEQQAFRACDSELYNKLQANKPLNDITAYQHRLVTSYHTKDTHPEDALHDWYASVAEFQGPDIPSLTAGMLPEDALHDWYASVAEFQGPDIPSLTAGMLPEDALHGWYASVAEFQRPTVSLLDIDILSKDIDIVIRISGISDKRTDLVKRADAESENKEPNEIVSEKRTERVKRYVKKYLNHPMTGSVCKTALDVIGYILKQLP